MLGPTLYIIVLTAQGTGSIGKGAKNCKYFCIKYTMVHFWSSKYVLRLSVNYLTKVLVTSPRTLSFICCHIASWKPRWDQRHARENEEELRGAAEETGGESVRASECLSFTCAQA